MPAALDIDDPRHGTLNGYTRWGCRCLDCRSAVRDYRRRRRATANIQPGDNDPRHGTINAYELGCRCDACKKAESDYQRRWRSTRPRKPKAPRLPRPAAPDPLPAADGRHGRIIGYRMGCRCEDCRAVKRAEAVGLRATREARALPAGDPRHGTPNGYTNWRCRCDPCKAAHTAESKGRYARIKTTAALPVSVPPPDTRMMDIGGTCPRCRSGVLATGEHLRDDLPPCYGTALPTRPGGL